VHHTAAPGNRQGYLLSLAIIGVLYFIFGFVTWLNGSLIPFLKLACELTDQQALLVTFAFYMSYFCLALPSSLILRATGFKRGMALGLAIMAAGAVAFIPAATARSYPLFLAGLFIQGMGLALLQTAANPYVSVIGPIESAARRISVMGICNKTAGAISPLILSAILLSGAIELQEKLASATTGREALLQELSNRVIVPYVVMAIVLSLLGAMILFSPLPDIDDSAGEEPAPPGNAPTSIFHFPHLLLGVVAIFVYVGVEVMAGDVITLYASALGLDLHVTKNLTSCTMFAMLVGYVVGILTIPRFLRQNTALMLSAIVGVVFAVGALVTSGVVSITFIALLGLANALMWPAIFPLAIDGLGRFTRIGSALLIMGIAGGAIIPQIYAWLARSMDTRHAFFWCTVPAYFYILFYAVRGCRIGRAR